MYTTFDRKNQTNGMPIMETCSSEHLIYDMKCNHVCTEIRYMFEIYRNQLENNNIDTKNISANYISDITNCCISNIRRNIHELYLSEAGDKDDDIIISILVNMLKSSITLCMLAGVDYKYFSNIVVFNDIVKKIAYHGRNRSCSFVDNTNSVLSLLSNAIITNINTVTSITPVNIYHRDGMIGCIKQLFTSVLCCIYSSDIEIDEMFDKFIKAPTPTMTLCDISPKNNTENDEPDIINTSSDLQSIFTDVINKIKNDEMCAWDIHCNLAIIIHNCDIDLDRANEIAVSLMKNFFDYDTTHLLARYRNQKHNLDHTEDRMYELIKKSSDDISSVATNTKGVIDRLDVLIKLFKTSLR